MKTIKINESQRRRLFEAYSEGFSFEELTMIGNGQFAGEDNSKAQYEYCCKHLGKPDGLGTSRAVFTLGDNTVLKLAYGKAEAGRAQNQYEDFIVHKANSPLLTRVYAADQMNYTWLVSEAVLPAREEDFEKILGLPFDEMYRQNSQPMRVSVLADKGHTQIGFNKYFDKIKEPHEERSDGMSAERVLKFISRTCVQNVRYDDPKSVAIIMNSDWFKELKKLVESTGIADITKLENFGIVNRDGKERLVLLDSGATMNILNQYYNRAWQR